MKYLRPLYAVFVGIRLCLSEKRIRKLAFWPWVFGVFTYLASLVAVYFAHPLIVQRFVERTTGIWNWLLYQLAWFGTAAVLFLSSLFVSSILILIFTSAFQSAIAQETLAFLGRKTPEEGEGVRALLKEGTRSVFVEAAKLLWLAPLLLLLLLAGIFPPLAPFVLLINGWLLAYQFFDISLDLYRIGIRKRLALALKHFIPLSLFGLSLSLFWAIPLVGVLLTPAAAAAAAYLAENLGVFPDSSE